MRKEYIRNEKIVICGTPKAIEQAEAIFDVLDDLEGEIDGCILHNEVKVRHIIQEVIDTCSLTAVILFEGKILTKEYDLCLV